MIGLQKNIVTSCLHIKFKEHESSIMEFPDWVQVNPNLYGGGEGGGGLLAYCTQFGIPFGHLGPRLLPW